MDNNVTKVIDIEYIHNRSHHSDVIGYECTQYKKMIYSAEEVSACLRLNTLGEDKMQPHNLTGQVLEHYRIKRPVGYGGMATVFLAEDLNLRRDIAVKVFEPAGNIARISSGALSGRQRHHQCSHLRYSETS